MKADEQTETPYARMLFSDLSTDEERAGFIESGRAYDTGILAAACQQDFARAFRDRAALQQENERLKKERDGWRLECQIQQKGRDFTEEKWTEERMKLVQAIKERDTCKREQYSLRNLLREVLDLKPSGSGWMYDAALWANLKARIEAALQ